MDARRRNYCKVPARWAYSHPPKASYGVASPRRTNAYCLRRRALSETFGGWPYHKLLETLANEFREHETGKKNAPQIFVTTHQPYFVNALSPEEVWILEKNKDGYSGIRRASDSTLVRHMAEEGLPLGGIWYSDYLDTN